MSKSRNLADIVNSPHGGSSVSTACFKNRIINGQGLVNQRNVSGTVVLPAGAYGHDRFKAGSSGCTYTFSTVENVTTFTITSGSLQQVIEGINLETSDYVLSWHGTAQGRINSGLYGSTGAVTSHITGGTNTTVEFNVGTLSMPQLEVGTTSTPFEHRHYGIELTLCQRYYYRVDGANGDNPIGSGIVGSSTDVYCVTSPSKVVMRTSPTCSSNGLVAYDGTYTITVSITYNYSTKNMFAFHVGKSSSDPYGFGLGRPAIVSLPTSNTAYFEANAEL